MTSTTSLSKVIRKVIFAVIWLVIWQVCSICIDNKILMAGPIDTLRSLGKLLGESDFRSSVLATSLRVTEGFFLGGIVALILAIISYRFTYFEEFISPLVTTIKAVPVVSFIIIVLIWSGPSVGLVISSLVVFPIIYINTLNGLKATDSKLLEMAYVYKVRFSYRLRYIYLPAIKSHLISAVSLAAGMAWKSGIAAELIDQTQNSLGNGLYRSKINLLTSDLLAWTVAAVILSFVFEKIILMLLKLVPGTNERRSF